MVENLKLGRHAFFDENAYPSQTTHPTITPSVTKSMFGLPIGFQNGMSWSHGTKTHKLVQVLANGPFLHQGPGGGAHGAGSLNQQYDFLVWANPENFTLFHAANQKLFHFCFQTDRHTFCIPYLHGQDFFLYGNLYLSLHYFSLFASLSHPLHLWRMKKSNFKNFRWNRYILLSWRLKPFAGLRCH